MFLAGACVSFEFSRLTGPCGPDDRDTDPHAAGTATSTLNITNIQAPRDCCQCHCAVDGVHAL